MKQTKYITVILLLVTLTLSFNSCSEDDEKDPLADTYKDVLKKYENAKFEYTNILGKLINLNTYEIYELNDEIYLSVKHPDLIGFSQIGYDKVLKSFYLMGVNISSPGSTDKRLITFVDINTIGMGKKSTDPNHSSSYAEYVRKSN